MTDYNPAEIQDTLPNTLSALIRVAADGFDKIKATPGYSIFMGEWHEWYETRDTCSVCLAGTVIAGTVIAGSLDAPRQQDVGPGDYPRSLGAKLYALDCVRMNTLDGAVDHMRRAVLDGKPWRPDIKVKTILPDSADPTYTTALRQMADELETLGE